MKITHQNIDKWLFDYCEGNLTSSDKKQLFSFLEENPEYREDLDAWKDSFLTKESVPVFEGTDALMVSETAYSWRQVAVASVLLLLLGGGAGYLMLNYDEQYEKTDNSGNGSSTKNLAQQPRSFDSNTTTAPFSTFNKKRDALPSSHTLGILPRIHSPNLVKNSASQTSHSSISNASLNFQAVNTANSESSEFTSSGQVFTKNQITSQVIKHSDHAEEFMLQSAENENVTEKLGDEQIKPREETYLPWQLTRVSDLNPDYLAGLPKRDYGKIELREPVDTRPPSGLSFDLTNTYEHELLQPSLFSLQQNASYSGGYRQLEGMVGTRARWVGTEHESFDVVVGFQDYKRKWKSAYGMYAQYSSYRNGQINTTSAHAFFSPKIRLDRYTWIEPSINLSYSFLRVSPAMFYKEHQLELYAGQPYSTQMGVIKGNQGYFDASASIMLQTRRMYASLGLSHLAQPNITILNNETSNPYRLPSGIDLTLGTDLKSKRAEELILSPQIGFVAQGIYHRTWAGAKVRYKNVFTAASASLKGELYAMAGVRTKIGSFAYKFDLTESVLMGKKMMSHGITASLYLRSFSNRPDQILDFGIGSK